MLSLPPPPPQPSLHPEQQSTDVAVESDGYCATAALDFHVFCEFSRISRMMAIHPGGKWEKEELDENFPGIATHSTSEARPGLESEKPAHRLVT